MRLLQQWQTLLLLVAFAFTGLVLAKWVWITKGVLKPLPNRQVFLLAFAFFASLPLFVTPQGFIQRFIPPLPEWKLAQPIPARTMMVFLWVSVFADSFCFSLFLTLSAIVSASIVLKGAVDVAVVTMLVIVIAMNTCLGAALVSLEMMGWRTKLSLVGRLWRMLWRMWTRFLVIGAIVFVSLVFIYLSRTLRIDWVKFIGWVETPVGTVILLPLMPAYHAIKATFDGVNVVPVLLTSFLAVFTVIMVWQALKVAAPFCEAAFLWSERQQRLTKMGAWEAVTQELPAKPMKSEGGFGSKAISLLWMYWLDWKRSGFWIGDIFVIPFLCIPGLLIIGILEELLVILTIVIGIFSLLAIFSLLSSSRPSEWSEWLKSQPISVDEILLMLALPTALRVGLWALLISLTLLLFSPEKVSAVNVFALALAAIAWGLGINFMVQALKISWRDPYFFVFVAVICIVGTRMFMTLTTNWLLGLLLSWAVCVVSYLWAKERWQKEP